MSELSEADKQAFRELKLVESSTNDALRHAAYRVKKCAKYNNALFDKDYLVIAGQIDSLKEAIKDFYKKFDD